MLSNYENFKQALNKLFTGKKIVFDCETTLIEASLNDSGDKYLYNGSNNLKAISMDEIAKTSYKMLRNAPDDKIRTVNTVDAFLIASDGIWYFVEFKDCKLTGQKIKDNLDKKGMANWLMLQDIFYEIGQDDSRGIIDLSNLSKFAREHIVYILVFNADKDPIAFNQVRDLDKLGEKYTPECLYKFKDYFFKDAYAYSEDYFEQRFVKTFVY